MNYTFHIRNWNVDFFQELEKKIVDRDPEATFTRMTMLQSVVESYDGFNKQIHYLPELLSREDNEPVGSQLLCDQLDAYLFKKYDFGLQFLFETERFKKEILKSSSLKTYVSVLNGLIKEKSTFISLTCDHFVYILSAFINEFYKGKNYFLQPIGFPLNACVILENPWNLSRFRESGLPTKHLFEYIDSLQFEPSKSIHYMKKKKNISLYDSFKLKLSNYHINNERNPHGYLNPKNEISIPSRFISKWKRNWVPSGLNLDEIKSLNEQANLFYFPLQFEPEMSITSYSPYFKDQIKIIGLISQSLRVNDKLLLKENPKMIGKRSKDYYEKLKGFDNIVWARSEVNSRQIIQNCFKVITVTGTASVEAACLGVDSLLFGYPPFNELLINKPISSQKLKDLPKIIYQVHSEKQIRTNLIDKWDDFSRSVFYGNTIPQYVGSRFTIPDSAEIATDLLEVILNNNYETHDIE